MKVVVSLGSNLGDKLANLKLAADALQPLSRSPIRKSAVYESSPVDCPPDSPSFLNAVVELEVDDGLSPHKLLQTLQSIERKLGRKPKQILNEPRPIDLDLIYCGSMKVNSPDLTLPHPRAHLRWFVLQPLCDLSPDLVLPGQTKTVRELLAALPDDKTVRLFATTW
ncbi:MAG: 2-amino-4-hydroxy-6-hydroxymethyldihydropteridine diphosphokinase [Verrucomicrobiae bacterium]|nr:2-amino-4-hydroxy-6-hydroxymethyldihydropteridine diphosphokinase [Verrucomicrobiae bacterium]